MAQRKLLKLRRDDTCSTCQQALPAGTTAYWLKGERRVMCRPCGDIGDASNSLPGASAVHEWERRRQARIDHQRARFGRIGGWAAEHARGPQHERAWAIGASGEARNAERLEKLVEGQAVAFLHDRRTPGSRANIDHIAIGPGGVFVIDSKNVGGQVKVDWRGGLFSPRRWYLYIGGRDRTEWVEAVGRQVVLVKDVLADAGYADVPVHGALCMANGAGLPWIGHPSIHGIAICRPRHIAKRLTAYGPLPVNTIREVQTLLDQAFPPKISAAAS